MAARQRAALLDIVLRETPPPWNPTVWRDAAADLAQGWDWLRFKALAWAEWYRSQGGPLALVQALFVDFGDSALLFELRCHVRDVDNYATGRSELLVAIEHGLRSRGIEVPYPQQVIHRGQGWDDAADEALPPPIAIRPAS